MDNKLTFQSKFTEEEICRNFDKIDFFASLMESLEEARYYATGHPRAGTMVHIAEVDEKNNK